jgi:hypothetical protein
MKTKKAKKKKTVAEKPTKTLSGMEHHELGIALNNCHNKIHQAQETVMVEQQNINSIMAEINRRAKKNG